jgi:hypothetical protein
MGSGSWDRSSFVSYTTASKCGATVDSLGVISTTMSNQEMFKARQLDPALNPKNAIRECRDSEEHPNTIPVILALDVTGSLGEAAVEIAKKLNIIMTDIYNKIKDVEFMIMGIGDFYCDRVPLQVSQFESDIRIAEQLDKLYFEFGGGCNAYESYTAAWYFGSRHCKLDCWERGKKGIIITMGDECINPYIPKCGSQASIKSVIGDDVQSDIQTDDLYKETIQKFDIYHLQVNHGSNWNESAINKSWKEYLDDKHFRTVNLNSIANEIVNIIDETINQPESVNNTEGISW